MRKPKSLKTFARIRPFHDGRYPEVQKGTWYLVARNGLDQDGRCWLVAYGMKIQVEAQHFDFRVS